MFTVNKQTFSCHFLQFQVEKCCYLQKHSAVFIVVVSGSLNLINEINLIKVIDEKGSC